MNQPIRILCVFGGLNRGGSETMCMNIYRNIDRELIQFDFVKHTPKKCDYEDEILGLGGRIFVAPNYKVYNHISYKNWWKKHLEEHPEHKIIHGHFFTISAIYLGVAKKYARKTIAHSHAAASNHSLKSRIKGLFQHRIRFVADYFMGCSQKAGEWLFGGKVCQSNRYFNVRNAINVEDYIYNKETAKTVRVELGYTDEDIVIGHVGRFTNLKNHTFLVDIFYELYKRNKKYKLLLIGDGELRGEIEDKIKTYQLQDFVTCTGVRKDVPRLLMAMDLFLFPSKGEGLPVSLIEAQATGLPCVISDTITQEVCVTNLVERVPLTVNAKDWCNAIEKKLPIQERSSDVTAICEAGYDVKSSVEWLANFYTTIWKDRK